ncbi:translocation/assembly module TamB domain-containing protein [Aliidiomarina sp. Khilg15.8]
MTRILRLTSRIVTYAVASILALALILMTVTMLLLSTETGSRLTLHSANKILPGELSWEELDGDLISDISFTQLGYQHAEMNIQLQDLTLRWRPWRLLGRQLHLRELSVGSAQVSLPASAETETDDEPLEQIELPDIRLPLSIRLDTVQLSGINIEQGDFSQHIDSLRLRVISRNDRFDIQRFALKAPQGELTLQGSVKPVDDYPLDLEFALQTNIEGVGPLESEGRVHGDAESLELEQRLRGIVTAEVEASAQSVTDFNAMSWQANVHLRGVDIEQANALVEDIDLRFEGSGAIDAVTGKVRADAVLVEYGEVTLASDFDFADNRLELSQLKLDVPAYEAEARLNGFAQLGSELSIEFNGETSALDFALNDLTLSAQGNERGAQQLRLQGKTLAGDVNIAGRLLWDPVISWDLTTNLNNLDTGSLLNDFPGTLSLAASTQGQLGEQLEAQVQIDSLTGTLRELALDGQGALDIQGSSITARDLQLHWGDNRLLADGTVSQEEVSLNWELELPQLNQALPEASGTLQSSGAISGSPQQPQIQLNLSGSALTYGEYSLTSVDAEFDIASDLATLPTGQLRIEGIELNDYTFDTLELQLRQNAQHQTELSITSETLEAALSMQGDWNAQDQRWQGSVEQLQLRYPEVGRWNLSKPTSLSLSPNSATLGDLCLMIATRDSEFCARAEWDQANDVLNAFVNADTMSFQILRPWMPQGVDIDGEFDINGELQRRGAQLNLNLSANLHETRVAAPEQDISVVFDRGELLRINGNQDSLDIAISLQSQQIDADIRSQAVVRNLLADPDIDGELSLQVEDLSLISILSPSLQSVAGVLNGAVSFSGPLASPAVDGGLQLEDGRADIPATGLALENIRASVDAPNSAESPITFTASADAGEGQIEIDGDFLLSEQRANVNIVGDAFPALRTRDIDVTVAPDLQIEYTPELLRLRGSVTVPSARITPPDIESTDSISSDTRLVNGEGSVYDESVTGLPTDMDIEVRLGDDVQVAAYGFEGRLTGRLRIIDEPGQEMVGVGNIAVATGLYEIYGQSLSIQRGRLIFTGGPISNPGLDLRVERHNDLDNVTVGAQVGGSLQNPNLSLFSTPSLQDSAILSYLIFGRGPGQSNQGEQNMLARASLALGMSGGNRVGERLSDTLGVDEVMLDSGDTFESTSLYIGKQLSSRLYVKYGIGLVEPVTTFFIRYRLTDNLDFESQTGNERSGADLFYSIER